MSDQKEEKSLFEKPVVMLAIAQFLALVLMVGYVFAVVETKQKANTDNIQLHDQMIESNRSKIQEQEINQAVNNEQYRQIIQRLDEISKAMKTR